jgi:hypothetical protein
MSDPGVTIMSKAVLAALFAVLPATRPVRLTDRAWVELPDRPSKSQFECVPYREDFWSVSLGDGTVVVQERSTASVVQPLPFAFMPKELEHGDRRVTKVADGWLVGFDQGEFGGGLWWVDESGGRSQRLRPPRQSPVNKADPYQAENVLGFADIGGRTVVLMGLDHLSGRSGRAFAVQQASGSWRLAPLAVFDASPEAWLAEDEYLLVVTESGLWKLDADGRLARRPLDLGPVGPVDSIVRAADGALYLGLRHYVLRLEEETEGLRQTWFAPSGCTQLRMRDRCECAPAR